ncbi:MAG: hypothetical protein ACFFF9_15890 [Candidatus Thorarchaeota archaeon]
MNAKNLFVVGWVVTAIAAAFLIYEYYTLMPYFFIVGLAGAAFVGLWRANRMKTRDLVVLVLVSIFVAFIDEYAHTSSGVLVYFDLNTPSLLTVMGWSLFLLVILSVTEYLSRTPVMKQLARFDQPVVKTLPALIAIFATVVLVWAQGYLGVFDALLTGVYVSLGLVSLYYSQLRTLGWNLSILISSVAIGGAMEFLGGLDGMWWYFYLEPMAWFMVFTWALRTWTIFTLCSFVGVKFKEVL